MPTSADFRAWCAAGGYDERPISERDRRGLRLVSIAAYAAAVVSFGFAVVGFAFGGPHEVSLVNLVSGAALAVAPTLRRFGPWAPPTSFFVVAVITLWSLCTLLGEGVGLLYYYLVMAVGIPMIVGVRRLFASAVVVVVCLGAVIYLHFTVPDDTGLVPHWFAATGFVVNVIVAACLAVAIVGSGLFQIERAETALAEELRRSDALLNNILPRSVAERLKQPDHAEVADSYDDASVLFADIAGFTEMSSHTAPADVVRYLDRLYTTLDALVERHGLEKVKTTGDSYMVVSGVPEPRPDHLQQLARFAIALQGAAAGVPNADGRATPLRIGLADGPVVAGIVGSKKFFFDVWGDAVNVASRMESTGVVGRIQVTASVHERLVGGFAFEERGVIAVKGKPDQTTWFLLGERASGA
ncbi:adenylate/guanylate cyclase domain-containing protein [Tsukamurella pseudospumae]|uniref:adenylate/guanylate cyclase domain-containing protein n=1 Tax=Tsukamurella pseudospumae TaxID=239498 RepID=UPI000AA002AC|nr:adenylate/guanylate cyclase domain-containing protein [Tsukamurella pseudospumae]